MQMSKTILVLALLGSNNEATFAQAHHSGCGARSVAIVVEPSLVGSIRAGLNQFENDLCVRGYNTVERVTGFTSPTTLRTYLRSVYYQLARRLSGVMLIGDFPHAYQLVTLASANPSIPSAPEEVISLQYYADLNGNFAKSAAYSSPGGHQYSYDRHSGATGWEIWVGVLPRYKGDTQQTAAAISRYFAKNHAYRIGKLSRPNVFLEVSEFDHATTVAEHNARLASMRSGSYSWTPYSRTATARLYFDSPPGGLSVQQGYADMQNGVANFTVTDTHGSWAAAGQLTIATVESTPVKTLFFWSNGCAVGDLDHPDNFLTAVLYGLSSDVLVAKGTTNNSGGMGSNVNGFFGHNIAAAMDSGASFGDAILRHVNVPLVAPYFASREFHFGTAVVLGDPTLGRTNEWRTQASYSLPCAARPPATICVRYDDGFIWLLSDAIRAWDSRVESAGTIQTAIGNNARYEHIIGTTFVRVAY